MDIANLDLFILAMLKNTRLATLSDLRSAGPGSGAVLPSLRKLKKEGLISQSAGERGSTRYSLTAEGGPVLEDRWAGEMGRVSASSSDTVQRTFWLAYLMGEPHPESYLTTVAYQRMRAAKDQEKTVRKLRQEIRNPLTGWLWTRAVCELHRLNSEAEAFRVVAEAFEKEGREAWMT